MPVKSDFSYSTTQSIRNYSYDTWMSYCGQQILLLRLGISQSSELHTTSGECLETPALPPCVVMELTSKE